MPSGAAGAVICRDTCRDIDYDATRFGTGVGHLYNTDDESGPGQHWLALYAAPSGIYVSDSFASGIPRRSIADIYDELRRRNDTRRIIAYDAEGQRQRLEESDCGARACIALWRLAAADREGKLRYEFDKMARGE